MLTAGNTTGFAMGGYAPSGSGFPEPVVIPADDAEFASLMAGCAVSVIEDARARVRAGLPAPSDDEPIGLMLARQGGDVSSDDEPVGLMLTRQGGDVSSDDEPVGLLVPRSD